MCTASAAAFVSACDAARASVSLRTARWPGRAWWHWLELTPHPTPHPPEAQSRARGVLVRVEPAPTGSPGSCLLAQAQPYVPTPSTPKASSLAVQGRVRPRHTGPFSLSPPLSPSLSRPSPWRCPVWTSALCSQLWRRLSKME